MGVTWKEEMHIQLTPTPTLHIYTTVHKKGGGGGETSVPPM